MIGHFMRKLGRERAEKIRANLSIVYAVIAWNGFVISIYYMMKDKKDSDGLPMGLRQKENNNQNTITYQIKGFSAKRYKNELKDDNEIQDIKGLSNFSNKDSEEFDSEDF